jgi:hypothetical protein
MTILLSTGTIDPAMVEEAYNYDEGVLVLFTRGTQPAGRFFTGDDAGILRAWIDEPTHSDGPPNWAYIQRVTADNSDVMH